MKAERERETDRKPERERERGRKERELEVYAYLEECIFSALKDNGSQWRCEEQSFRRRRGQLFQNLKEWGNFKGTGVSYAYSDSQQAVITSCYQPAWFTNLHSSPLPFRHISIQHIQHSPISYVNSQVIRKTQETREFFLFFLMVE